MSVTAGRGIEQLREQLVHLRDALASYHDPVVAEHPGLALMHRTLQERADHIHDTIAQAESAALDLTVAGEPVEHGGLPLDVAHLLLAAVQQAVRDLSPDVDPVATALELVGLEAADGRFTLRLGRRPGPLGAQPADEDGRLLLDLALERLVSALDGEADGPPGRAAAAVVAGTLDGAALTLEAALRAPTVAARTAVCDAQALAALRNG